MLTSLCLAFREHICLPSNFILLFYSLFEWEKEIMNPAIIQKQLPLLSTDYTQVTILKSLHEWDEKGGFYFHSIIYLGSSNCKLQFSFIFLQ